MKTADPGDALARQPNIVLCVCDQLRAFEVGCYGNAVIRTPHVDRLASEGARFETAVTNYPVCMASRSVLLSGQYNRACTGGVANVAYPGRPGEFTMPQYPEAGRPHLKDPTLPEILRAHGYRTSAIGKWHIHSWPNEIGFDDYLIPRVHHCHTGQSFTTNGGPEFVPSGYSEEFVAERAEAYLRDRSVRGDPFFLYVNISVPHCPLADAPEAYRGMYRPADVPLRANVDLDRPIPDQERWFKIYRYDFRYYSLHLPYAEILPDGYSLRHLIAEYYGMTTWMDAAFGRMLDALDETGLAEDTLVVFTSDHGDNLGSHGLVQKGGPNEESIRVPLIVRWPRIEMVSRVDSSRVVGLVDLAPTILSLVGIDVPGHFHGRDRTPMMRGESADDDSLAVVETENGVALRTSRYLYFLPYAGSDRDLALEPTQLYDLIQDPYQRRNLAGDDLRAEPASDLDTRLRRWNASIPWMPV